MNVRELIEALKNLDADDMEVLRFDVAYGDRLIVGAYVEPPNDDNDAYVVIE